MYREFLQLIVVISYVSLVYAVNECQLKATCKECISFKDLPCAWCEDVYYRDGENVYFEECDLLENHNKQGCSNVSNPQSDYTKLKDKELGEDVRVSPQEIKIQLRPGQSIEVPVEVETPENFPIDLYYLMDLSDSMKDDLEKIKNLGELLADQLKTVTTNFRLGFGGFVDKPLRPYTKAGVDAELFLTATNITKQTFSYTNYLPLSEEQSKFGETVGKVKSSYNVDTPEGSLDALMQVIVCQDNIGWRNKTKARRIVIITTDSTFHYSGDGLLAGVVRPNDGTCKMRDQSYIGWGQYDYPSLSQVRKYLQDNGIVPIFATTGNQQLYKKVAAFFGQGAQAEKLKNDSSNIVPLIKSAYERIARTVAIDATPPAGIKVDFSASCGSQGKTDGLQCDGIQIGEKVTFIVNVTAETCDIDNPTFAIKTSFDDVDVTIELLCDCDCTENPTVDAVECTSRGNLSCGDCLCDETLYGGRFCQCTAEEANNQTKCQHLGPGPICSGRGYCDCGECICDPPKADDNGVVEYISGVDCSCSNITCPVSNNNQVCGGPDRGTCECLKKCKCKSGWTGLSCNKECSKSVKNCYDPESLESLEQVCNAHGECKCNKCNCEKGYIGDYCQECVGIENCPDPCRDYRECVKCKVFETSDLSEEECEVECTRWNVTAYMVVDKVEDEERCLERDEDDCSFIFTFRKDNVTEEVTLLVQRDRICPAEPDILAIILGVIAGIVGIGLALLLIWKLLATIQDRREFAKFENDVHNPKWDSGENPIYKKATSTFQNPMYGDKGGEPNDAGSALIE